MGSTLRVLQFEDIRMKADTFTRHVKTAAFSALRPELERNQELILDIEATKPQTLPLEIATILRCIQGTNRHIGITDQSTLTLYHPNSLDLEKIEIYTVGVITNNKDCATLIVEGLIDIITEDPTIQFDLVIMDFMLGNINGGTIAQAIQNGDILMAFTGLVPLETLERARNLGINRLINRTIPMLGHTADTKPFIHPRSGSPEESYAQAIGAAKIFDNMNDENLSTSICTVIKTSSLSATPTIAPGELQGKCIANVQRGTL